MALEAEKRIPDITLADNEFKDGDILHGADLNKVTSVLKAGVNENYKDLKESDALSNEHILDEVRHIKEQERNRWNNTYTKEEVYTREDVYTKNEVYNKNETYAKENLYTKEETYSKNDVYTKDNVYTKSEVDRQINDRITEIGSADMRKAIYDTNSNGIVDNSERLGGQLPSYYATKTDVSKLQTDVSTLQTNVSGLQTDVSELQTKSFEGTSGTIETKGGYLHDMMIFGKSVQDGTPTPDSPIEIQSVVNPSVKVIGKNLLNKDSLQNYRVLSTSTGNISDTSNAYCVSEYIEVKKGYIITITNDCGNWAKACVYDINKNFINCPYNQNNNVKEFTITIDQDGYIVCAFDVLKEYVGNSMIELGSVATKYEPYKEQSATLPYTLNAIPVSSGGNVTINGQEYISDYVDIENKKLVRMVGDVNLENFTWEKQELFSNCKDIPNIKYTASNTTLGKALAEKYVLRIGKGMSASKSYELAIDTSSISIGNPDNKPNLLPSGKFLYELATPTEIDLTDEEVAQFKALKTYIPTTNIIASSDVLNPLVKCDYSLNKETNNIYDRLQENASDVSNINTRLNGLTFVTLTQSEYDALSTKDDNTIYFITEG